MIRRALILGLAALAGVSSVSACTVPVFRYALDRWPADAYRLEVPAAAYQDAGLAPTLRNLGASSPLNVEAATLPPTSDGTARLLFPHDGGVAWAGGLDADSLAKLTDSPARREMVRRILAGESAIWVLVESGVPADDEALAAMITKRLTFLESAATLPVIDPNDPTSRLGPGPQLRVKFSLLRLRRDDPAEAPLLAMLAGPGAAAGEAFLAAVFGRGRVLGAWPLKDLAEDRIDDASMFLLGACSCEVKRLNPGWDLLLNVNWERELELVAERGNAGSEPAPVTAAPAVETVTIQPTTLIKMEVSATIPKRVLVAAAVAMLCIAGGLAWRAGKAVK